MAPVMKQSHHLLLSVFNEQATSRRLLCFHSKAGCERETEKPGRDEREDSDDKQNKKRVMEGGNGDVGEQEITAAKDILLPSGYIAKSLSSCTSMPSNL